MCSSQFPGPIIRITRKFDSYKGKHVNVLQKLLILWCLFTNALVRNFLGVLIKERKKKLFKILFFIGYTKLLRQKFCN